MTIIRQDPAELQYYDLWSIIKNQFGSPIFYQILIIHTESLFQLCNKPDLIDELHDYIFFNLEQKFGYGINQLLWRYANMWSLNKKIKHPLNTDIEFSKDIINLSLLGLLGWIRNKINVECVPVIRFQRPPKQLLT